jgi:hypothetical protein
MSSKIETTPNHTLQRTRGQRCFAAQCAGCKSVVVPPPPLSVAVRLSQADITTQQPEVEAARQQTSDPQKMRSGEPFWSTVPCAFQGIEHADPRRLV